MAPKNQHTFSVKESGGSRQSGRIAVSFGIRDVFDQQPTLTAVSEMSVIYYDAVIATSNGRRHGVNTPAPAARALRHVPGNVLQVDLVGPLLDVIASLHGMAVDEEHSLENRLRFGKGKSRDKTGQPARKKL